MIDYSPILKAMGKTRLSSWAKVLPEHISNGLSTKRYGDLGNWLEALDALPALETQHTNFSESVTIGLAKECSDEQRLDLEHQLKQLKPWRKGPFNIFGIHIDTEWRSDLKWDRLLPYISPLTDKQVLDVGCGNGYHCWRMFGEGARRVIGIDPSPRFVVQFYMLKQFVGKVPVDIFPVGIQQVPENLQAFDTTFSMGVLYHRRSPMDHLRQLRDTLRPGGELVLETLIIRGELGQCLVPEGRYAKMNNVWFIPTADTLQSWLRKCGFDNVRCVDINQTQAREQRVTPWIETQSLEDFLDPSNPSLTVEGHPAPLRAIFIANRKL